MKRTLWIALLIITLVSSMIYVAPAAALTIPEEPSPAYQTPTPAAPTRLAPIAIGSVSPQGKHLRVPREEVVLAQLMKNGTLRASMSAEQVQAAVDNYYEQFLAKNPDWIIPDAETAALKREAELANLGPQAIQPVTATVFGLAVQFAVSETLSVPCDPTPVSVNGPLQGKIPFPDPGDNNTLWYSPTQTANTNFYYDLVFGYNGLGRIRYDMTDPQDGQPGINLAGYTLQDYYDNVAGKGNVAVTGIFTGWVTVNHSEGYYGAPKYSADCSTLLDYDGGLHPTGQIVADSLEVFSTTHPGYYNETGPNAFWPKFDLNKDGVIDAMWIVHAGADEAGGGGAEGQYAIWSHSWSLTAQGVGTPGKGFKVYEGDPSTTDDDIYVDPYTAQPENPDLGVLVEEFGHNFFLLPDLYTTDAQNSTANWDMMSAGSWMGWLGGVSPVGMPLWFREIAAYRGVNGVVTPLNWQEPMIVRNYDDPPGEVEIGNLERPDTTDTRYKGVRVNLPSQTENVANRAGTGQAAFAPSANNADWQLSRQIAIPAAPAAPNILTLNAYWETEPEYDFAYVMVNGEPISDTTGFMIKDGPPNFGPGFGWGLNGAAPGGTAHALSFDLSKYAGQTIELTLRLWCDTGTNLPGFWVDDIALDGAVIEDFETAVKPSTFPNWTADPEGTWLVVPYTKLIPTYYLIEWRAKTKYDQWTKTAYVTTNTGDNIWTVERTPYNIPGAVVNYRNAKYPGSRAQRPWYADPPSFGSKNKLLVVDMNFNPVRLGVATPITLTRTLTGRTSSYDSALTLQDSQEIVLSSVFGVTNPPGPYTFTAKTAITNFSDARGYYAGFYYPDAGPSIYYSGRDDSCVIPARTSYSTRITHFDLTPFPELYGERAYDPYAWWLGTGNPGDDNAQFGVNFDLVKKTGDDAYNSTATLRFNSLLSPYKASSSPETITKSGEQLVTYKLEMNNAGTLPQTRQVTMTLDANLTYVSSSQESVYHGGAPEGNKYGWIVFLDPGQSTTLSIVAKANLLPTQPATVFTSTLEHSDGINPINTVSLPMKTNVVVVPAADFTPSAVDVMTGEVINFTNETAGVQPIEYQWDFNDGITSTLESPTHAFAEPGTYTVTLQATNVNGTGSAEAVITVNLRKIYLPFAAKPNN